MYKVAYQTPIGWFIWDDLGYSSREKAQQVINKEPVEYAKNMFIVHVSQYYGMERV